MATTPNLGLTLLDPGQNQKEVTINEGLGDLDTILGAIVSANNGKLLAVAAGVATSLGLGAQLLITGGNLEIDYSGNAAEYLDGSGSWSTPAGGGTVTSVSLSMPAIFSVSGSPITSSGTLGVTLASQSANLVLAGPASGGAAAPAFRALVAADLPLVTTSAKGAAPTLSNNAAQYLDGTGNWTTPAGGGGGITSLGAQTGATQTFAAGSSGTDFNISSGSDVHTFNIPSASAANRGLVTTGTQTFAGSKTFSGIPIFSGATSQGNGIQIGASDTVLWRSASGVARINDRLGVNANPGTTSQLATSYTGSISGGYTVLNVNFVITGWTGTNYPYAIYATAWAQATTAAINWFGNSYIYSYTHSAQSGTITDAYTIIGGFDHQGSCNITNLTGMMFEAKCQSGATGTIGTAVIMRAGNFWNTSSAMVINNLYGFKVDGNAPNGGVGTYFGLRVNTLGGGTVGTYYGVYIDQLPAVSGAAVFLGGTSGNARDGITFGSDTNLYRSAADALKTDDELVAGRRITSAVVALTDGATIATNAALGNHCRVTLGGNRTLGNPTNGVDGQKIIWEIIQDGTGSRTITLDTKFALGTDITAVTLTTTASKRDFLGAVYNSTADKWYVIAFTKGY